MLALKEEKTKAKLTHCSRDSLRLKLAANTVCSQFIRANITQAHYMIDSLNAQKIIAC